MDSLFSKAREPLNSMTHFVGAVLSFVGTLILVFCTLRLPDLSPRVVAGSVIFGLSLVALYSASAAYHYVNVSAAALLRLRKLDHSMIFVLIAGTYTPLFLHFSPERGFQLTLTVWSAALCGIVLKIFWMGMPRLLSTLFYVALGWALVFDPVILHSLPAGCMALLLIGGLAYTVGAVIYWLKKPNIFKKIGFHELFHFFVLAGSAFHFLAIFLYTL